MGGSHKGQFEAMMRQNVIGTEIERQRLFRQELQDSRDEFDRVREQFRNEFRAESHSEVMRGPYPRAQVGHLVADSSERLWQVVAINGPDRLVVRSAPEDVRGLRIHSPDQRLETRLERLARRYATENIRTRPKPEPQPEVEAIPEVRKRRIRVA